MNGGAEEAFDRAEKLSRAGQFREAMRAYREAASIDSSGPLASVATARADAIAARSEGDFVPLARLEEARAAPDDRAKIDALARDAVSFPDGPVRSEARVVAAESLWRRGELARASELLDASVADRAATRATRGLALEELAEIDRERGDLAHAIRATERDPDLIPPLAAELRREARRPLFHVAALVVLVLLVLAFGRAVIGLRARKERILAPFGFVLGAFIGIFGTFLALSRGGDPQPFWILGIGVVVAHAAARAMRAAATSNSPLRRLGRATFLALSILALAFLALERTSPAYLDGIGL